MVHMSAADSVTTWCRSTVNPPISAPLEVSFVNESEPRAVAWRKLQPKLRTVPPLTVRFIL